MISLWAPSPFLVLPPVFVAFTWAKRDPCSPQIPAMLSQIPPSLEPQGHSTLPHVLVTVILWKSDQPLFLPWNIPIPSPLEIFFFSFFSVLSGFPQHFIYYFLIGTIHFCLRSFSSLNIKCSLTYTLIVNSLRVNSHQFLFFFETLKITSTTPCLWQGYCIQVCQIQLNGSKVSISRILSQALCFSS